MFDAAIYRPNALVGKWMGIMTAAFVGHAIRYAPARRGTLKAGIHGFSRQVGPKQVEGLIASDAKHTMYVLRGTGFPVKGRAGRIYTTRGFSRLGRGLPMTKKFFDVRKKGDRATKPGGLLPGTLLHVGKQSLYPPITKVTVVSGQEPNNFLERAWRATARNHRSIRGVTFPHTW